MIHRIAHMLRLKKGETGLVLTLGLLLMINALAQQVTEITAISNFLSVGGAAGMLIIWIIDGILVIALTGFQSLVVDRYNRVVLVRGLMLVLAGVFGVLWLLYLLNVPPLINYALLFLVSEQQWLFFPLVFWLLAGDVFQVSQSKRLFPLIGAFGFVGKLLGIGAALVAPLFFSRLGVAPASILVINLGIYLLAFAILVLGLRSFRPSRIKQRSESMNETLVEGWSFIKEVPSFRFITLAIVAILVSETALEYHFLFVSESTFSGDVARYQTFYSLYQLGRNLLSIAILGLVANRVLGKIGIKNSFLILPVGALAGSIWMLLSPASLFAAVGGMLCQKLPQYTIDESARKTFQALAPERIRGRVSIFIDSYVYSAGTILGSFLVGLIVFLGVRTGSNYYVYGYLSLAAFAGILAIMAIMKMRSVYDSSLLNWRLQRRKRGRSVLDQVSFD
jgi:AAA family ATP:ADP antiporter